MLFVLNRTWRGVVLLEDTPYRIAAGSACGIFAAVLPIIGQTIVGIILARILRGNVIASVPWSWISNPLTTLPILYGCYVLGAAILPGYQILSSTELERMWTTGMEHGWWSAMTGVLAGILVPMWLGSLLVGVALAIPGYYLVHRGVSLMHQRRAQRAAGWVVPTSTPS